MSPAERQYSCCTRLETKSFDLRWVGAESQQEGRLDCPAEEAVLPSRVLQSAFHELSSLERATRLVEHVDVHHPAARLDRRQRRIDSAVGRQQTPPGRQLDVVDRVLHLSE